MYEWSSLMSKGTLMNMLIVDQQLFIYIDTQPLALSPVLE